MESNDSSVLYLVLKLAWCCDLVFDGGPKLGWKMAGQETPPMRWMLGRFTKLALNSNNTSASEAKLSPFDSFDVPEPEFQGSTGNRIMNFQALMGIISILCCPECYATGLKLAEDSKEGLCSNLCVACSCGFMTGFTSTPKENKKFSLNTLLVFGMRLIGRGFTAGKKLLCTLNLPCISKNTFRAHELKLLEAVQLCSEENMKAASKEVPKFKKMYNLWCFGRWHMAAERPYVT
ncbi:uncharacterized protein TNCV_1442761 [Trichonephila clavipes]|nr:uncharacterized protein TNCV_1442761 [Trichonephila clavipes]